MHVLPSPQVHANQADEIYLRIGDKSKKLNFAQRLQLLYSKGTRFFEDTPVPNATINDIDLDFVAAYTKKIGYGRSPLDYLRGNKDFIITRNGTEQIISATILLFGKNPQRFFPRARVACTFSATSDSYTPAVISSFLPFKKCKFIVRKS